MAAAANGPPAGAGQPTPPGTISLQFLVEVTVQKAYHELTILAELLPHKDDKTRKMEVLKYVHETRGRFLRLLVLIRWAGKSKHLLAQTQGLVASLQEQSTKFLETANSLHALSQQHEGARLPAYAIPNAIDVLTTGDYPRLPAILGDVIPTAELRPAEAQQAIQWLNHQLRLRLTDASLPPCITGKRVAHGRVWLTVEHMFELSLTLAGPAPASAWRLLSVDVLVEDHPLIRTRAPTADTRLLTLGQTAYLHRQLEARLLSETLPDPLAAACDYVLDLCVSLQLDVLRAQATRFALTLWDRSVAPPKKADDESVVLEYWRVAQARSRANLFGSTEACRLIVSRQDGAPARSGGGPRHSRLVVSHSPLLLDATGAEAALALDHGNIDLSALLTRAQHLMAGMRLGALHGALQAAAAGRARLELRRDLGVYGPGPSLRVVVPAGHGAVPLLDVSVTVDGATGELRATAAAAALTTALPPSWPAALASLAPPRAGALLEELVSTASLAALVARAGRLQLVRCSSLALHVPQANAASGEQGEAPATAVFQDPRHPGFVLRATMGPDRVSFAYDLLQVSLPPALPAVVLAQPLSALRQLAGAKRKSDEDGDAPPGGMDLGAALGLARRYIPVATLRQQLRALDVHHSVAWAAPTPRAGKGRDPAPGHVAKATLYELPPPTSPRVATLHAMAARSVLSVFATKCVLRVELRTPMVAVPPTGPTAHAAPGEGACSVAYAEDPPALSITRRGGVARGAVHDLLRTWQGVCHVYELAAQRHRLPEAQQGAITCSASSLHLRYGGASGYEAVVCVAPAAASEHSPLLQLRLHGGQPPGNPHRLVDQPLLQQLAQAPDLAAFQRALTTTLEPLQALLGQDSRRPLPEAAPFPLAGELLILPRSAFRLRLSLLSKLALDVALDTPGAVVVTAVPPDTPGFDPAAALACFLLQAAEPLAPTPDGALSLTMEQFRAAVGPTPAGSPCALHDFLLAVMSVRVFVRFATHRLKLAPSSPPSGAALSAAFSLAGEQRVVALTLTPTEAPYLRLGVQGIPPDVADVFHRFLLARVACAPFRPRPMASLLGLLALPADLQQQFAGLLERDMRSLDNPAAFRLHVSLDGLAPNGNPAPSRPAIFSEDNGDVYFAMRVPLATPGEYVDLPVCFQVANNRLGLWDLGLPTSPESEALANKVVQLSVAPESQQQRPNLAWIVSRLLE